MGGNIRNLFHSIKHFAKEMLYASENMLCNIIS